MNAFKKLLAPVVFLVVLFIYCAISLYIWSNISDLFQVFNQNIFLYCLGFFYFVLSLSLPMAFILSKHKPFSWIRTIGMLWLCVFIYLVLFFIISDVILLFVHVGVVKNILYSVCLLLAIVLSIYGFIHNSKICIKHYDVKLEKTYEKICVAYISDLHLGSVNSQKYLTSIVNKINQLNADIVCFVGDIFDGDFSLVDRSNSALIALSQIYSRYGVYACLGNHDAGKTSLQMVRFLEENKIKVLNEDFVVIDNKFVLVGRLDKNPIGEYDAAVGRRLQSVMHGARHYDLPIIIMEHTPPSKSEKECEYLKDDLLLCGHTHKGRIRPFGYVTNLIFKNHYGYSCSNDTTPHIVTSCGVGSWGMPMRIGTTKEVVCIDITL